MCPHSAQVTPTPPRVATLREPIAHEHRRRRRRDGRRDRDRRRHVRHDDRTFGKYSADRAPDSADIFDALKARIRPGRLTAGGERKKLEFGWCHCPSRAGGRSLGAD